MRSPLILLQHWKLGKYWKKLIILNNWKILKNGQGSLQTFLSSRFLGNIHTSPIRWDPHTLRSKSFTFPLVSYFFSSGYSILQPCRWFHISVQNLSYFCGTQPCFQNSGERRKPLLNCVWRIQPERGPEGGSTFYFGIYAFLCSTFMELSFMKWNAKCEA